MEEHPSKNDKNVAALMHISTFLKYFFPFGNFIAPLILWTIHKDKPFVHEHGRQAINFQLSILLYTVAIGLLCLPFFVFFAVDFVSLVETLEHHVHRVGYMDVRNLSGYFILFGIVALLLFGIFVFELYAVVSATVQANRGGRYQYPLSISFINSAPTVQKKTSSS
ncbi:DUF4870 domain-containing protein [Altibacter sp. HG106]|uniref:DUF4870 domain-containing protein n=1 Tax=Altibacter sp. HG106 TaxID=3023937 RepID=UPI0023500619|nr:DUF4870 domain-containing protein [Altibacter sp. HG106]MDC7993848.1 DUF4870 domain-containing protein [Altibacter sp. HG106]